MDRIINQISTSTSLIIVRFMFQHMKPLLSPLDTIILCTVIICFTYIWGQLHEMVVLSRRLSVLLIVQTLQPMLSNVIESDIKIQSIILNCGIISIMCVIPENQSNEIESLITSIMYLYSNVLDFLVAWHKEKLSVLVMLAMGFWLNNKYTWYNRLQQIISISIMTTVSSIVTNTDESHIDAQLFQFSMFLVILHVVSMDMAHQVEDVIIYSYVEFVQTTLPNEPLITSIMAFFLSLACKVFLGVHTWQTRASILIFTNIIVQSFLNYIQRLAVYDSIVTLKTSALVLQFFIHIASKQSF